MAERPRRRRGHAAASTRILTAGLSSAAAFGMVAGMAVTGATDNQPEATPATPPAAAVTPRVPAESVVVVRRYLRPGSVPLLAQAPARPAPPAAPRVRATPPVTRTRAS